MGSPFIFNGTNAKALTSTASAGNFLEGYTTTATAAGTTTLTVTSNYQQFFTGTTTQTVVLPVTSTLVLGQSFYVTNNSTGVVTVQSSGANNILAMAASSTAIFTCILISGTTAASWSATYVGNGGAVTPTVQKFASGISQTYTTPANVAYLRVRMVGGGGGGSGSGTAGGQGATGVASTFGNLTAGPGVASGGGAGSGGAGGSATIGAGWVGTGMAGSTGGPGDSALLNGGGNGGTSAFGGGGGGGSGSGGAGSAGASGAANSGSGGGGGGSGNAVGTSGSGGGAAAFVDAVAVSPNATYTYTVGGGGANGAAGVSGSAGGSGAAGYIEVTEFYNNGAIGTATNVTGIVAVANGGTGQTQQLLTNWVAYTPIFTGLGTVASINAMSRRVGDSIEVMATFTTGTVTGVEARMEIGSAGTSGNITSSSGLPTISIAGVMTFDTNFAGSMQPLIEASKTYLTFGLQGAGNPGTTKTTGTNLGSTRVFTLRATVPISGWTT